MKHELYIGQLILTPQKRDAIHIAVAPVIAGDLLDPGQRIGFLGEDRETVHGHCVEFIGIVDPFLQEPVRKGERFWMFLFPNTVTSLRHEWDHPQFPKEPLEPVSDMGASEIWLRKYANEVNSYYEGDRAYQMLVDDLESESITYHGRDMHTREELENEQLLKYHAEIVLGHEINFDRFEFSCSC